MKQRKAYKTYTAEFKQEAVRLMEESERLNAEIARELGIPRNRLYKWKEQLASKGDKAFSGSGRPKREAQSELLTLKQENERLKEENEILKKAFPARKLVDVNCKVCVPLVGAAALCAQGMYKNRLYGLKGLYKLNCAMH